MSERLATLLSDWDGTGVEIVPKIDPRNWFKIGMPVREGYIPFLNVADQEGLDFCGIVTIRKKIFRGPTTALTVANQRHKSSGFRTMIGWSDFTFAGNERGKADHTVSTALDRGRVVLLDDKPHNIGLELLQAMRRHTVSKTPGIVDVTLAVVDHPKTEEYMQRFFEKAPKAQEVNGDGVLTYNLGASAALHLVTVEPYSADAARILAEQIANLPLVA